MKKIDTSGLSCPGPVLMAKKELEANTEGLDILVDNEVAKENVSRFLKKANYSMKIIEDGDNYLIEARK